MIGSARRPIVKVQPVTTTPGEDNAAGYKATCHTQGCEWASGPHMVRAAADEQARWHREQHRRGQA